MTRRAIYRGRVQGVGFRRRTQRIAEGFAVTGFVRNLPDGSVELVAEGEPVAVEGFLLAVATAMASEIVNIEYSDQPARGFADFVIKRSD